MSIYLNIGSFHAFLNETSNFFFQHWMLIGFVICVVLCNWLLNFAVSQLASTKLNAKTLKPAEVNFTPLLFSVMAGWLKYYFTDTKDLIFLIGTVALCLVYGLIFRDSYHFNIIFKVCFGYRYYEMQEGNVTYLLISKKMIYDTAEITSGIKLTDYMIINTSPN